MFEQKASHPDPATEPSHQQDFAAVTSHGVPARGRGAATLNPTNRFEKLSLHVLGDHLDAQLQEHPEGVQLKTIALHDECRTIINKRSEERRVGKECRSRRSP